MKPLATGVSTTVLSSLLAACAVEPTIMAMESSSRISRDPELTRRAMTGNTLGDFSSLHGSQYTFHAENGQTFLWYPGNSKIVKGQWKLLVQDDGKPVRCYKYSSNSYNPVTGLRSGPWRCVQFSGSEFQGSRIIVGDPFELASGRIPFRMQKLEHIPPREIAERIGIRPENLKTITSVGQL
ncbi:hypothetical protein [uncultured Tateyamaria sp.]|uniref:hypothetical protein n=1 Tax=uncultured Tateyamaria sp. TaxID=455651 RepID=UPI002628C1CF|nr:hypothetical protein [uncultured Tateyamaria sp.]